MNMRKCLSSLLAMLVILSIVVGCSGQKDTSSTDSVSSTLTEDTASDEATSDDFGTESTESVAESPDTDSTIATSSSIGSTGNTSGGNSNTTVKKDFGVTSTKKMPNYISKITSPNIKVIVTAKSSEKEMSAFKQAFKAVTGKDIAIQEQVVDWNTLPDRVAGMVAAKQAPDLVTYSLLISPYMIQKPYWEDLNNYINIDDALMKAAKEYNPNDLMTFKGARYAFQPYTPSKNGGSILATGYIYNTALVKEAIAGNTALYDPQKMFNDDKWTWDALYAFVEEITTDENNDGVPEIYGHVMEGSRADAFVTSAGQDIVNFKNGKIEYNLEHPDVIRALNMVKKFAQLSNHPAPWEGIAEVVAKKAGFYYGNAFWMKDSKAAITAHKNGQIAFVPFPRDNNTKNYYINASGTVYLIPKGSKNPYMAGAYLYAQQYLGYNPNKKVQETAQQNYKDWGFTAQEIEYIDGSFNKIKVTPVFTGIGERIDGFSDTNFGGERVDPNITVTQTIQKCAPVLKAAIKRFNEAK